MILERPPAERASGPQALLAWEIPLLQAHVLDKSALCWPLLATSKCVDPHLFQAATGGQIGSYSSAFSHNIQVYCISLLRISFILQSITLMPSPSSSSPAGSRSSSYLIKTTWPILGPGDLPLVLSFATPLSNFKSLKLFRESHRSLLSSKCHELPWKRMCIWNFA